MKVMILAAGRGERMRPLTDREPKPLLTVRGKALIDYHLERLASSGFTEVVINCAWLGQQIVNHVGNGQRYGLRVQFSLEPEPLETAGGILRALPLLKNAQGQEDYFAVINGDVWTDYPFAQLKQVPDRHSQVLGHLVMVNNPEQHPQGDFCLQANGLLADREGVARLTYSGISVLHPRLFDGAVAGKQPLKPFLLNAMLANQLTGEHYLGDWQDIGTPQRLDQLNRQLSRATA